MKNKQKIGDFLKRIKCPIRLSPDKEYKLVTIKMNHKGVVLRGLKKGGDIKSNMFEVKQGDFILSGIDARNGAFGIVPAELDGAIVTNDFWYFEIDESVINKSLFLELTSTAWFDEICKRGSDGTTQRIRLQKDKFFNQEIYLPLPDSQQALLTKIQSIKKKQTALHQQSIEQQEQVKQLKQVILQEAIQGKLTKGWRVANHNIESVSELLKRIKAEKQKLIDEKKIRKEKPSPVISDEEIPFPLPDGWVWCRLGEALLSSNAGKSPNCEKRTVLKNEWGVLTTTSIQKGIFDETANKVLPPRFKITPSQVIENGDILITRAGPLNRTGVSCKIHSISKKLILSDKTIRLKHPTNLISPDYIVMVLNSNEIRNQLIPKMTGMADSQVNISQGNIKLTVIPLPTLLEQKAIFQKVESLMQKCTALESEIKQSENHTEQLMQAVIKEAFNPESIDNKA